MPTWIEINSELEAEQGSDACDTIRHKYLDRLTQLTGRPTISYYSGWLQKLGSDGRHHPEASISDLDMSGFMAMVHGIPRDQGLDLILHTPGGGIEPARAIVSYLRKMFGLNIRAIVPHLALSAGTMIACSTKQVLMSKHSFLGPTDPQISGAPAIVILGEIQKGLEECRQDSLKQLVWQQVFSKFPPGFITNCERAVDFTKSMVAEWLATGMFEYQQDSQTIAAEVTEKLMKYEDTLSHSHHYSIDECRDIGLNVTAIEDDQDLQEAILSVHHSFMASFQRLSAIKIIQNNNGDNWATGL